MNTSFPWFPLGLEFPSSLLTEYDELALYFYTECFVGTGGYLEELGLQERRVRIPVLPQPSSLYFGRT